MDQVEMLLQIVRDKGFRVTNARRAILAIFSAQGCPLSAQEVFDILKKTKIASDRSTVYREIQFLVDEAITKEIFLQGNARRFELMKQDHHHHLVCNSCGRIKPITLQKDLDDLERKIAKKQNFKVTSHSLEFYGTCKKCS